jgi:hypothetical protein
VSPTALTLNHLRRSGYVAAVVETWIPKIERRRDLWAFADVLAVHAIRRPAFVLIQCTSIDHVGDRLTKAKGKPELRTWLRAGGVFEVWGWARRANGWALKRISVTTDQLVEVTVEAPPRRRRNQSPCLFE